MSIVFRSPKPIVAAIATLALFSSPVKGEEGDLSDLLRRLQHADPVEAQQISREIDLIRSRSGSAAINLLLKRGRAALDRGDYPLARDHLTALTDHAPDFSEGWVLRAQVWHALQEPGLALSDLQRALSLAPNHYEAMFGLAVTLEQLGNLKLAYQAYELVLRMHPHYEEASEAVARLASAVQGDHL
jgi:tetratricopeptide (TPR) repeat protein